MGQPARTSTRSARRIDGQHLVERPLGCQTHAGQLLGPEQIADDHEAVAVEQLRRSVDLRRIEDLEALDAVVPIQSLAELHDVWIVVRPRPVGTCRIAADQVVVLRGRLDVFSGWCFEAQWIAVAGLSHGTVGETVRRDGGVPAELARTSLGIDAGDATSCRSLMSRRESAWPAVIRMAHLTLPVDRSGFTFVACITRGKR